MEQSTLRRSPGRAVALALALSGGAVLSTGVPADDDVAAEASTQVLPPAPATARDDAGPAVGTTVAGATFRPRWVDPQREEAEPSVAGPSRDWRRQGRVLVHVDDAEARLADVVEVVLERLGARDVGVRIVEAGASTDQVRYFHAGDASMAAELAAALEVVFGDVRVRDLTFYHPQPSAGTLEVWLR